MTFMMAMKTGGADRHRLASEAVAANKKSEQAQQDNKHRARARRGSDLVTNEGITGHEAEGGAFLCRRWSGRRDGSVGISAACRYAWGALRNARNTPNDSVGSPSSILKL